MCRPYGLRLRGEVFFIPFFDALMFQACILDDCPIWLVKLILRIT